jgi:hypothetical protein
MSEYIEFGASFLQSMSAERLLQGPLSDAMTHAGQLTMLRRLAGNPVPRANFIMVQIQPDRFGSNQAKPISPDEIWPDAPPGWLPPSKS